MQSPVVWYMWCIYCILNICRISGLTVTLNASTNYAVLGRAFQFLCTVTDEDNISLGTVGFSRSGESSLCSVIASSCTVGPTPGYICGCVSGQSDVYYMNISSVTQRDEDTWQCSRRSTDSNNFLLLVYYGPGQVTLDRSSPYRVNELSTLTVGCSTSCKPCTYVWKKESSIVSTSQTLTLTRIKRNHTGDYQCSATNNVTRSTASSPTLTVIVLYRPEVSLDTPQRTSSCRPYRVYVGQQNVQLTCRVTAANPAVTSYIWAHNGSTIPSATSRVYTLSSVSRSSGGSYTCAGRNSVGDSSRPPSLQVDVQYSPSVSMSDTKAVIEGKLLTVTCSVASNPAASVRWTRKDGGSFTPQNGSALNIPNIQRSQTGTYVCTATNTLSPCSGAVPPPTPVSKEVTVDVQYNPIISGVTSSYPVTETSTLHINCSTYTKPGRPTATRYTWTGPRDYTSTGPVLSINNIDRSQRGQYTCNATNTLTPTGGPQQTGTATGHFNVDVHYPAVITSYTINSINSNTNVVTASESESLTMRCVVDSNPASIVTLYNGSRELSTADNALTDEHSWIVECRQRGNYSCSAVNNIGRSVAARKHIQLIVKCRPRLDTKHPQTLQYASAVETDISLSATFLSHPEPSFTWMQTNNTTQRNLTSISSVSRLSDVSVTVSLNLVHLQKEDFGDYLVQAFNGAGQSTQHRLKLSPPGTPTTPANLTILSQGKYSIQVAWIQEFNGGDTQIFTVEYSIDDISWEKAGTLKETSVGKYLQMNITGLSPQTQYFVRIAASNIYGTKYTKTINTLTKNELQTDSSTPVGLIAGLTIGVLVTVAVVIVVMILFRKGFRCVLLKPGSTVNKNESSVQPTRVDDIAATSGEGNTTVNPYTSLSDREPDQLAYTELRSYENAGITTDVAGSYESFQTKQPHVYEDIKPSLYENTI